MAENWVNLAERIGADLHLDLPGGGRRAALTRALRVAVRSGRLAPGTRLPPCRALAADLGRTRGVRTDADHIVVCSGFAHALRLLFGGGVLPGPLAVEGYGLPFHRALLDQTGTRTRPLTVDGDGARVDELSEA